MRSLALGASMVLLCAAFAQDEGLSIEEELQTLIDATNAHASFWLVYRGSLERDGHTHPATLEIAHEAPDRALVRVIGAGAVIEVVLERVDYFLKEDDGEWKRARIPESESLALLEELLPAEDTLAPGVGVNMKGGSGFWFPVAWSDFGRLSFFGCFGRMRYAVTSLERVDGLLLWREGTLTVGVSRESGFPVRIDVLEEDLRLNLTLVEVDLDASRAAAIMVPDAARRAEVDADIQAIFDSQYAHWNARQAGFVRLGHQLREGMRTFDAPTQERFRTFLEHFHARAVEERWADWVADVRANTAAFCDWAREARAFGREAVQSRARERRQILVSHLDEALEKYSAHLTKPPYGGIPEEAFELEREVVAWLHGERVSDPILAHFDAEVEAALGD